MPAINTLGTTVIEKEIKGIGRTNYSEDVRHGENLDSKFNDLQDRYDALFIDDGERFEYTGFASETEKDSLLHDWGIAVAELKQKTGSKHIITDEIEKCF